MIEVVLESTGEVLELDTDAAERRAEQILFRLHAIVRNFAEAVDLIRQAVENRDDQALGYPSLGAYVIGRFSGALSGLDVETRRAFVAEMTEVGVSSRAIAKVVEVDHTTVHRDRRAVAPATPSAEAQAPRVDGSDGKSYPRRQTPRRRRPLPDAFRDAVYETERAIERLSRLVADDRFAANVANLSRSRVLHLQKLLNETVTEFEAQHPFGGGS